MGWDLTLRAGVLLLIVVGGLAVMMIAAFGGTGAAILTTLCAALRWMWNRGSQLRGGASEASAM
ncbi:hypothetical protein GCM10011609_86170 [Lentzea pudingi]|uniref:Uncharacterized protein n=1 Tax=Lentzea pudingi TaxID=1789439 RepID=A0ABQ2IWA0_9PSEU|nr:hypothetical protein [Lentzea pudingi]GGN29277.1 hypothetical protein GCM10011609_86170 [Lentzea pudingi]